MLRIFKALYLLANIAVIIALLSIHFVFKESTYQFSLSYYSFPLPVIIGIVLCLSIFLSKGFRKYNLLLAALLLLLWLGRSFKIHFSEEIKASDIEIVFWNASHDNNFEDAFNINKGIPDVLVLVEARRSNIEKLQLKYPDYFFYQSVRKLFIFSKTPLYNITEESFKFGTIVMNFETANINFYAIDAMGSIDVPKSWGFKFIDSKIDNSEASIILGDFNVPYESKYLDKIKKDFKHAFNEKGNGFRETWFWNIPLLSLDHIWVSKDLEILKTEKIGTFKSDHSMLKTVVRK